MIKPILSIIVVGLCACSRSETRPPYTEGDVRAFVQPGTAREALIQRFGTPLSDDRPKLEDGDTSIDEIMIFHLPFDVHHRTSRKEWVFAGFIVRLKDQKTVSWDAIHADR